MNEQDNTLQKVEKENEVYSFWKPSLDQEDSTLISKKGMAWLEFSITVLEHIENYAVPQYGPDIAQNEDVESAEDCRKYMAKYLRRAGSERRGRIEELRDLVKIANFAQFAFDMMKPIGVEVSAIRRGTR